MTKESSNPQNTSEANRLRNNIQDARQEWDKITQAEFSELDGSRNKLAKLVESRYNIAPEVAEKQVQKFMDLH
ncbi:MAG: hypothetical protein OQJ89_10745 [Kangiellaceae bacterium]|nr:hypothetical protein [Kangiellaceae bacterium]MCW8999469.1 hypothetical protein [Kangiellaceae bacterium]MCW9017434.1 hypothetical protein [Kangiellaceae bacterium]